MSLRSFFPSLLAGLVLAGPAAASEPRPGGQPAACTDCYGDPLPAGALARLGTLRLRHSQWVQQLSFAADGQTLLARDPTGIDFWDTATGRKRRRFSVAQDANLLTFCVPTSGRMLGAVGSQQAISVWDLAAGRKLREARASFVNLCAFSPNGRWLAFVDAQPGLCVWEVEKSGPPRRLEGYRGRVQVLAFSPDGHTLLAGDQARSIRLWDVVTGQQLRRAPDRPQDIALAVFSPDGKRVATVAWVRKRLSPNAEQRRPGKRVRLWDLTKGEEVGRCEPGTAGVGAVAFAPDGGTLAVGEGPCIHLWDAAAAREVGRLQGHCGVVSAVAFAPDGKRLASAGWDNTIRLWNLATGRELLPSGAPAGPLLAVALAPDGRKAATAGREGNLLLWNTETANVLHRIGGVKGDIMAVHFAADGQQLISGGSDGAVRVWDAATGRQLRSLAIAPGYTMGLALAPDQSVLAVADPEGKLLLWEPATGREIRHGQSRSWYWPSLALAADNRTLFLAEQGNPVIHVWDMAMGREVRQLGKSEPADVRFAFSRDGRRAAVAIAYRELIVLDLATGQAMSRIATPREMFSCLAFSPDGRILAVGGSQWAPAIRLWEVATGKLRREFPGHVDGEQTLAFAADGRRLISGSFDTTALVWDVSGRGAGRRLRVHLSDHDWNARWAELAGPDAVRAGEAIWVLADAAEQSPARVQARLQAIRDAEQRIDRLIAALDDERFSVRQKATAELRDLGKLAEPALRKVLARPASAEARIRSEQLLRELADPLTAPGLLQALRAVEVLELIGSTEARKVLETLARGAQGSQMTQEAHAALERLAWGSTARP